MQIIAACPKEAIPEIMNRLIDSEASLGEKLMLVESVQCAAVEMSDKSGDGSALEGAHPTSAIRQQLQSDNEFFGIKSIFDTEMQ